MTVVRFIVIILIGCCNVKFISAQLNTDYYSIQLNDNQQLLTNRIYDCAYDHLGNLWLATDAGVSKYNGIETINYSTNDGLADNEVLKLYVDNSNNIWLMCNNGKLCMYNSIDHKIYNSRELDFLAWIEDGSRVISIYQSPDATYYISTFRNSYKIDRRGKISKIQIPEQVSLAKSNFFEMDNGVYFITHSLLVNATTGEATEHHIKFEGNAWIGAAYANQSIYLNCHHSSLTQYNPKQKTHTEIKLQDKTTIHRLSVIHDSLYISANSGVYQILNNNPPKKLFHLENTTSLSYNTNNQSFAVSTYDMGCIIYPDMSIQKITLNTPQADPYIAKVFQTNNNQTIAIHNSSTLSIIKSNQLQTYSTHNIYSNRHIYTVIEKDNKLSIITERTLTLFDLAQNKITDWLTTLNYKDEAIDKNGQLYILNPYFIDKVDITKQLYHYQYMALTDVDKYIDMEIYKGNYLIIRSDKKIFLFDCIQKRLIHSYLIKNWGLDKIFSFYVDYSNKVWLSTAQMGVIRYDPETGKYKQFDNTLNKDLNYQFQGNATQVFVYNNNYIFKYDTTYDILSQQMYLPLEKINDLNVKNQTSLIATSNGIIQVNSTTAQKPNSSDYLQLNSLSINGIEQPIHPVQLSFDIRNKIELDCNFIPASYLNFKRPYYRIIGFQKNWQLLENRKLTLPVLPPGKYQAEFGIVNNKGEIHSLDAKIPIHILVPFWNRWYIKGTIILFIIAFFTTIIVIILRINNLVHKRNESQIAFLQMEKKRSEAEYKAFFLQINPHFIFNTINNIKNIYNTGDPEQGNKYVQQFAKSMRNVLEFADMNYISIEQEINYLSTYCDIFKFSIDFTYEFNLQDEHLKFLEIPPMILQPFIENAIIHGLQNKAQGERLLQVTFSKKDEEHILVEITDNGVGRNFRKKSDLFNKTSKGLDITQKRLELLNGGIKHEYIKFVDLKDANEIGIGTQVKILIPYRH